MGSLVIVVTVEDRNGNVLATIRTSSEQEAEAAINGARTRDPDALITRTEQEVG